MAVGLSDAVPLLPRPGPPELRSWCPHGAVALVCDLHGGTVGRPPPPCVSMPRNMAGPRAVLNLSHLLRRCLLRLAKLALLLALRGLCPGGRRSWPRCGWRRSCRGTRWRRRRRRRGRGRRGRSRLGSRHLRRSARDLRSKAHQPSIGTRCARPQPRRPCPARSYRALHSRRRQLLRLS